MTDDELIHRALDVLRARLREPGKKFTSSAHTSHFLTLKMAAFEHEVFSVMYLDSQHRLIEYKEMFQGTIDASRVYPREIVKMCVKFNAAAVILSHNHPSGHAEPSLSDEELTKHLQKALDIIDVRVLDHIVVGHDKTVSMAERGLVY